MFRLRCCSGALVRWKYHTLHRRRWNLGHSKNQMSGVWSVGDLIVNNTRRFWSFCPVSAYSTRAHVTFRFFNYVIDNILCISFKLYVNLADVHLLRCSFPWLDASTLSNKCTSSFIIIIFSQLSRTFKITCWGHLDLIVTVVDACTIIRICFAFERCYSNDALSN